MFSQASYCRAKVEFHSINLARHGSSTTFGNGPNLTCAKNPSDSQHPFLEVKYGQNFSTQQRGLFKMSMIIIEWYQDRQAQNCIHS